MSGLRSTTAISLDQDRLVAVGGSTAGDKVKIKGWTSAQAPEGVDPRNAKQVGEWVRTELQKASLSTGRLVIAVPRGDVVLKKLKLPRAEGAGESELAGMVRLQMARQLTMGIEGTAIDYAPIDEGDSGASVGVLAGALPADKMAWYKEMASAAGCSIDRVGLRASGAAALLAAASHTHNGPVLGVAIGWSSIEFLVVRDGQLVFARAADVGLSSASSQAQDAESALGQKIAVEAKRTWMSYRVGDEATTVEAVVVPGDGPLARDVGDACGKALEMPWELAALPTNVELPNLMSEADRLVAGPLIGLLGEEVLARRSLDFANPRKPPDLAAARRQRMLAAMLGLIVIGGSGYVYSDWKTNQIQRALTEAKDRNKTLREDYNSYLRDHARLSDLQKWTGAGFDWLAHASWLSDKMPDPRELQLDLLSGDSHITVSMTAQDGRYDANGWQSAQTASFSIKGRAKQREVSNQLRSSLVDSPVYQVETKGADLPDRFGMELTTDVRTPDDAIARAAQPKVPGKPAPAKAPEDKASPASKPPENKAAPSTPPKKGGGS
jgi:Tfp pilus assembly PilM family ATPase